VGFNGGEVLSLLCSGSKDVRRSFVELASSFLINQLLQMVTKKLKFGA
jgi:hypothetical protein